MSADPAVRFRPLQQWPGPLTAAHRRLKNRRLPIPWGRNMEALHLELRMLNARNVVIQLALDAGQARRDGLPRAGAAPAHPGVILTFDDPQAGPLAFVCDQYDHWQANVRAITLTLYNLRSIERHGAVRGHRQYTGWAQLPPPDRQDGDGEWSVEHAARLVATLAGGSYNPGDILTDRAARTSAYRAATRRNHPDTPGSLAGDWATFDRARRILEQHARLL